MSFNCQSTNCFFNLYNDDQLLLNVNSYKFGELHCLIENPIFFVVKFF